MTRTEKNKTKKLAKVFNILTWSIILIFFGMLISLISGVMFTFIPNVNVKLVFFFTPMFIGIVFLGIYGVHSSNLREYRRDIWHKRQSFYLHRIIGLLKANDIQSAVDIYNDCLIYKTFRNFLYGMLISEFRHSIDSKWNAKAEENLQRIFNDIKV